MLCLGYIRHSFGITIWFLNREENLQLTITIFQQKITFNVFSLVPARKDFLAIQKWSHKYYLCWVWVVYLTLQGGILMVSLGWSPRPISWALGLSVYDAWRQQCTPEEAVTWHVVLMRSHVQYCAVVSAPHCHLGTLGSSILVWYHLSSTCFSSRARGLERGLRAQEQNTPFPFTPHWPALTSQFQPACNKDQKDRGARELFTEH